jgi:ribosomal protein S18 acetylase RimI-like enzyme
MDNDALIRAAARNHRSRFLQSGSWNATDAVAVGEVIIASSSEVILAFPDDMREIDSALALARARGVSQVSCWSLWPTPSPDLAAALLARGFSWGWQPHWMALDLSEPLPDFPAPSDLEIRLSDSDEVWKVSGLPYYAAENPPRPAEGTWRFGAWLGGKVVGQSVLHVSEEGIGGIFNVGVVPEQRRRGIGRAVSRVACEHAKKLGCRFVLLNAATHIYHALGFRSLGYGQTWWIFQEAIAKTPLPPEQVTFVEALGRGDVDALGTPPLPLDDALLCGMTPLELCAKLQQQKSADWLLNLGATPDVLSLYDLGRAETLPALLAERPELASRRRGEMGATPLHEAVERNDLALARLVLAAHPDLSLKDHRFHATPLDWARHLGRTKMTELIENSS